MRLLPNLNTTFELRHKVKRFLIIFSPHIGRFSDLGACSLVIQLGFSVC
jgi:hypothetical protein